MDTITIKAQYSPQEAVLHVTGPITEELAIVLDDHIDAAFGYYGYDELELQLHSPGGALAALDHIMHAIKRWRERGHRVRTCASMTTGSAAALLLALGEVGSRTALPHSRLLFHHGRVITGAAHAFTAAGAVSTARHLNEADRRLVSSIVNHLITARGSTEAVAAAGQERCAMLERMGLSEVRGRKAVIKPVWARRASKTYAAMASGNPAPLVALLAKVFAADCTMDLNDAFVLQLIDRVEGLFEGQEPSATRHEARGEQAEPLSLRRAAWPAALTAPVAGRTGSLRPR